MLFAIADGMGERQAGEVAAEKAIGTIKVEYYADALLNPGDRLRAAIYLANIEVYKAARSNPAWERMGSTIVAAAVSRDSAWIANVGNSRAYLVERGNVAQITQDHSLVGAQVAMGCLTPEQARIHPQRNVLTRALGMSPVVEVDIHLVPFRLGSVLILCSDGLTEHVAVEAIFDRVMRYEPERAVVQLIDDALNGGGSDNISLVVIRNTNG